MLLLVLISTNNNICERGFIMYCPNCGKEYSGDTCPNCGYTNPSVKETINIQVSNSDTSGVRCPKCGSNNLQVISDVKGKGAKLWKLCLCGFLGLCGVGKTKTEHYWICHNCGNKFKI